MTREIPGPQDAASVPTPYRKVAHGVRMEHPGFDNPVYRNLVWLTDVAATLRHTDVEGSLPPEGPAIVVANHSSMVDTFILNWLATKSNRSIRLVARDTLIHPEIQEEDFVLERTGKKGGLLNNTGEPGIIDKLRGKFIELAGNPILVHRGKPSREFLREADEMLRSDQMVGIFLQETRSAQTDLSQPKEGAATITRRNPDVPVYVVALTNAKVNPREPKAFLHPTVTVDTPFTYRELAQGQKLSPADINTHIVDRMSEMLQQKLPNEAIIFPGQK